MGNLEKNFLFFEMTSVVKSFKWNVGILLTCDKGNYIFDANFETTNF